MEALQKIYQSLMHKIYTVDSKSFVDKFNSCVSNVRPFNKDNVLYYYLPLQGVCCYTILSVNVTNPALMVRLFPKRDFTNSLLLSATCGAGLWLWSRPHMAATFPGRRFTWAFLGGSLWSLGSILIWAIMRNAIGRKPILGTLLGISSGAVITFTAIDYFNYLELMFCGAVPISSSIIYEAHSDDDEKYDIDL